MAAGGMLLNIILNIALIPHFKAVGSGMSSIITQGATAIFQVFFAQKLFKFKINLPYLGALLVFVTAAELTALYAKMYISDLNLSLLFCMGCFTIYALLLRIVNFKSLRKEFSL